MLSIHEITIEDFEEDIYNRYLKLFPKEERREWSTIKKAYQNGYEKFYKIVDDGSTIGFYILGKITNYPYYLDYFAIYEEYQSQGYGSKAIKKLLEDVIKDDGLIGEIEKVSDTDLITQKRWQFYEKLGFKKINNLYFSFNGVVFNLIIYPENYPLARIGDILMDYYKINIGEEETNKVCRVIK